MKTTYHIVGYPEDFKVTTERLYTHAVVAVLDVEPSRPWICGFCGSKELAEKRAASAHSEHRRWGRKGAVLTTTIAPVEEVIKQSRNRKG